MGGFGLSTITDVVQHPTVQLRLFLFTTLVLKSYQSGGCVDGRLLGINRVVYYIYVRQRQPWTVTEGQFCFITFQKHPM